MPEINAILPKIFLVFFGLLGMAVLVFSVIFALIGDLKRHRQASSAKIIQIKGREKQNEQL